MPVPLVMSWRHSFRARGAGIACQQIWLLLTRQLGVLPSLDVPAAALAVLVVAAVPLAVAIAAWPGEAAARISPALALRAE